MTTRQLLGFFWISGAIVLFAVGVAFVLLYTWPLKYLALGELSVLVVWGPLMMLPCGSCFRGSGDRRST